MKTWLRKGIVLQLMTLFAFSNTAVAAPIPVALTINGTAVFDVDSSAPVTGSATQTADLVAIQGGASTSSTVNDLSVTGNNPVGGALTNFGDGVGISANVNGEPTSEVADFVFDFAFDVTNTSLSTDYQIFFELDFSNFVDANGSDAYVDGEINLFDRDLTEFFASDLTSDTLFGDESNGLSLNSFGAELNEFGTFIFDLTLSAGMTNSFTGILKIDGGEFANDGFFSAETAAFISVIRAVDLTTPADVPEPSVFAILLCGLFLILIKNCRLLKIKVKE